MHILRRCWRGLHRNERGQIAILVGAMMVGLIGFSALAIDVGSLISDKRDLQNAADAMALAGAIDLPSASAATTSAQAWATKNNIQANQIQSISVLQQSLPGRPNPQITVTLKRTHDFTLARVIGVNSSDLTVTAAAIKTSPGGSDGVVPWAVLQSEIDQAGVGGVATLKFSAHSGYNGDYGGLAIDGTGASTYRNEIQYGSNSTICSAAAVAQGCVETAPECSQAQCLLEPGNMQGPTRTGVDYRIANTSTSCDTFAKVFTSNGSGGYNINENCNPWVAGSQPSLRVVIVPIINNLCGGSCYVTIQGFALFFLEGYGPDGCANGHDCEVNGRFVRAEITTGALMGVYDPNSLIHFIRLTQ